ncbi:F-box/kelch-repeat protein At3g23880-like [Cornus florida]|uniref:F-box/kelch-repeat protein At3g23880-like n=1 Tax=Cornus florida TaxID=4283 RepID=UPI0028A2D705|nr:F-box/kelch-repeat protein At3g23880-like [Cornus florida]
MGRKTKREKKGEELSPILPHDLTVEILSRLPVKSIVLFKCVCKSWLTMFADSQFIKLHLTRSNNSKLVLTHSFNFLGYLPPPSLCVSSCGGMVEDQGSTRIDVDGIHILNDDHMYDNDDDGDGYDYDYDGNHKNTGMMSIDGSCRGLVLCHFTDYHTLYLVNPSTGEVFKLPDSPFKNSADVASFGLGYDSSLDDYKVVVVSLSMFLNGKFHWFDEDGSTIVSLSLDEEKFGDVPLRPG